MPLHVHQKPDADRILKAAHETETRADKNKENNEYLYAGRYSTNPAPKFELERKGVSAEDAYRLIHDELTLDGSTVLNLASFVHVWMPPHADKLMQENMSKNLIDADEYPATQSIHQRCISMVASLWNAPSAEEAIGTATTGSSEAVQLGGLAMKKMWQERRAKAGKSKYEPGPNVVMGANAQVALEKFARYFDVEMRLVPVSKESRYCMDPKRAMEYVDENTIGVFVIMGSTYTGHYENVKEMCDLLDEYEKETGNYVPVHVDAASGGFVAPFVSPDLVWDFRLPRVVSINTSGHKFGLSYVGVCWIIWRDKPHLPKDLIFEISYLGSKQFSFSLNFSRPAAPIIAQYFNFVHLGMGGYKVIAIDDLRNARLLSRALEETGWFTVVSDIHRKRGNHSGRGIESHQVKDYEPGLPVVSFHFTDKFKKEHPNVQQRWIQVLLRAKGWIVPNYALPPEADNQEILRVVVKENMAETLVDRLVTDIVDVVEEILKEAPDAKTVKMLDKHHHKGGHREHKKKDEFEEHETIDNSGVFNHPC